QSSTDQVEQAVLDWGTRYPQHPVSNAFLSKLIDEYIATAQKVKTIAVLLPQQGKFATAADTIKNGLLSAYYADSHSINRPILRFYDTSDPDIAFSQLLQRALDEGATNVIGPLDKSLINKLAIEHALDAPVLTLNYGEHSVGQTDNLFQFGLAPEDEARQVAELAIRQGRKTAVILAPDSDWGRRLQTAFQQYFETLGGRVLSSQDYSNSTADFSRPIRRLLNLDQSAIRHRRIEDTLGERLQFIPYRRQDVDMIFIAATSRAARGIMPAFKFHHAADLPVYATSHVYTGTPNVQRDNDLNGLLFCDMPWVLENSSNGDSTAEDIQALKQTFLRNWPDQQRYTRLFALGVDAYHLVFNLEYLHENDFARFSGATGNIQLDENNRIVRSLLWAKFINGRAVYIEPEIKLDTRPDEAGPATLPGTTPASL
ncbi:MAG TPA: penicillin-binding protein activator, partial [Thiotrichales bacterium]|nr:penicillin-binding protein activator [Thiotrichales bacterium]